jgi:hypothetical protein
MEYYKGFSHEALLCIWGFLTCGPGAPEIIKLFSGNPGGQNCSHHTETHPCSLFSHEWSFQRRHEGWAPGNRPNAADQRARPDEHARDQHKHKDAFLLAKPCFGFENVVLLHCRHGSSGRAAA